MGLCTHFSIYVGLGVLHQAAIAWCSRAKRFRGIVGAEVIQSSRCSKQVGDIEAMDT